MEKASNKLHIFFFWPCITWMLVFLHALISMFFYFRWVSNCAADAALNDGLSWHPTSFDLSDFYQAFVLSLLLISSRVLDFTTKRFQIVGFCFTLILIFLSIILGLTYSGDPQHGGDVFAYGFYPLVILSTLLLFSFGLGNFFAEDRAQSGKKIIILQLVLSIAAKVIIWLPIIYYHKLPFQLMATISFLYVAAVIVFSVLAHVYYKKRSNNQSLATSGWSS